MDKPKSKIQKNQRICWLVLALWSVFVQEAKADLGWHQQSGGGSGLTTSLTVLTSNNEPTAPNSRQLIIGASGANFLKLTDLGALTGLRIDYNAALPLAWGGTAGTTAQAAVDNLLNGITAGTTNAVVTFNGTHWTIVPGTVTNGKILGIVAGSLAYMSPPTGVSSAPMVVSVTDATNAPNGRVLTGSTDLTVTDNGAGSTEVIALGANVAKLAGAQTFSGTETFTNAPVLSTNSITTSTGHTVTFPDFTDTVDVLGQAQTISAVKTFSATPKLSTNAITTSGGLTATFPNATDTITENTQTQTLTNKTIQAGTFTSGLSIKGTTNSYNVTVANPSGSLTANLRDPGGTATFAWDDGTPVSGGVLYSNGNLNKCTSLGTSAQVLYGGSVPTWGAPGLVNPMTTLGDIIYENATPAATRLAGNTATTKQFLSQTGTGSLSAAPVWAQPAFSDLSGTQTTGQQPSTTVNAVTGGSPIVSGSISAQTLTLAIPTATVNQAYGTFSSTTPAFGTVNVASGGTGATSLAGNGALVMNSGGTAETSVAPGSSGNVLQSNGTTWISAAPSAGFSNPMTTLGDIIAENSTPAAARIAGQTTSTKMYLSQTGTGTISALPTWSQPQFSELSGSATTAQEPATTVNTTGNLSPLFNSSISAQALSFSQQTAAANSLFGNFTNATAVPTFGQATVAQGGTGATALSGNGAVVMNSAGTAQTSVAASTAGNLLSSNGTTWISSPPTIALGSQVTGILPEGSGGTGVTSIANHGVVVGGATTIATVAPATSGNVLTSNGTDWISSAPSYMAQRPILTKSANYTLVSTDSIVQFTTGASALVATLPAASATTSGITYTVVKTDAGAGAVAVTPASGTINGASNLIIDNRYDSVSCYNDGTNWWTL